MYAELVVGLMIALIEPPLLMLAAEPQQPTKVAEQTRFYSPDGKSLGTAAPQGEGSTRYYDAQGRSLGTSTSPARAPFPQR
jgi:hypothetical protein